MSATDLRMRYYVADRLASIAYDIRSNPRCWTQGPAFARDMLGEQVAPCSDQAVSWCADGHLRRLIDDGNQRHIARMLLVEAAGLRPAIEYVPDPAINAWNDDSARTALEVSDVFAAAARLAEVIRDAARLRDGKGRGPTTKPGRAKINV